MNDRPISNVLNAIASVTGHKAVRNCRGYTAHCPAHDDRRPSLSVSEGNDGRALLKCHAGCEIEAIVTAMGMTVRDLMPGDTPREVKTQSRSAPCAVSSSSAPRKSCATYATARDAVAELERQHGPRSADWTYHNAVGEPVGMVLRWDRPHGRKVIRPVALTGKGWIVAAMKKPRPLYRLLELAKAEHIFIVEGEKTAVALCSIGLVATTSAGGCKAAVATAWSPLAGKKCTIWPDNDDPGAHYADDAARFIASQAHGATVRRIEPPASLSISGDAFDFIEGRRKEGMSDGDIRARIEQLANCTDIVERTATAPPILSYQAFPTEALPEPVRAFVAEAAKALGCDPSYVALPLLSALAGAIGNTRSIQLKRGWTEPAILWTAIVGESGTLKTPAFKLV